MHGHRALRFGAEEVAAIRSELLAGDRLRQIAERHRTSERQILRVRQRYQIAYDARALAAAEAEAQTLRMRGLLDRGLTAEQVAEREGLSIRQVNRRLARGLHKGRRPWTQQEIALAVGSARGGEAVDLIAGRLDRSLNSVRMQLHRLGLTEPTRRWTPAEDSALAAGVGAGETDETIAATVGRSVLGVRGRRLALGLKKEPGDRARPRSHQTRGWSTSEVATLRDMVEEGVGDQAIGTALGRSRSSVTAKRLGLGVERGYAHRWTEEEDLELLRRVEAGEPRREIAVAMGRTGGSVYRRLFSLGRVRSPLWSDAEDEVLRKLVGEGATDSEIGRVIGRTAAAVEKRRTRQGLWFGKPRRRPWTEQELTELLDRRARGEQDAEIAVSLNRTLKAVRLMALKLRSDARRTPPVPRRTPGLAQTGRGRGQP